MAKLMDYPLIRRALSSSKNWWIISLCGAAIAALLEQSLALWGGNWNWTQLLQDLVRNGFIAVLVTGLTAKVKSYQDRLEATVLHARSVLGRGSLIALAVNGWSALPTAEGELSLPIIDQDSLQSLRSEVETLRLVSGEVGELADADSPLGMFVRFKTIHWRLQQYIGEGGRTRRLIYLDALMADLALVENSPNEELSIAARDFRARVVQLKGWVQHTNTVIVERLLVERIIPTLTIDLPTYNKLYEQYESRDLHSSAINHDPLYLVIFHIHRSLEAMDSKDEINLEVVKLLTHSLRRVLHSLQNELNAAVTCTASLLVLAESAISVGAGQYDFT